MRKDRFFVNFEKENEEIRIINREICHQIRNVLRKKINEEIIVFNQKGEELKLILTKISPQEIRGKILEKIENKKEIPIHLSLYCSLLKKANFEWVIQKVTELGVKEITPLITARTVKLGFNRARLEKIIKEAVEQSGRISFPHLKDPLNFSKALEETKNYPTKILCDYSGQPLKQIEKLSQKLAIFIGPEGGWSKEELTFAKNSGFLLLKLSNFNLRAETAAIVACFWAISKIEENFANYRN